MQNAANLPLGSHHIFFFCQFDFCLMYMLYVREQVKWLKKGHCLRLNESNMLCDKITIL